MDPINISGGWTMLIVFIFLWGLGDLLFTIGAVIYAGIKSTIESRVEPTPKPRGKK